MPFDAAPSKPKRVRRVKTSGVKRRKAKRIPVVEYDESDANYVPVDLPLPHLGDQRAPILVVLDPVINARPFEHAIKTDDMSWLAPKIIELAKLDRNQVQFIAASPSLTFEQNAQNKEVTAHLKAHEEAFDETVNILKPKLIVPMGARACRQIMGRNVQITKIRGTVIEETAKFGNIPVLPLLSPFYARRHPENEALFGADLETLGRVVSSGYTANGVADRADMDIQWCFDLSDLIKNPPDLMAVDAETVGLDPYDPDVSIMAMQITHEQGKALVIPIDYDSGRFRHHRFIDWIDVVRNLPKEKGKLRRVPKTQREAHALYRRRIVKQLSRIMENPKIKKVGQNFKFDLHMMREKLHIELANYHADTIVMSHLVDENMLTRNVDDLARVFVRQYSGFNDALNNDPEHQGKTRMDLLTPEKFARYSGGDTIVTLELYNQLLARIKEDRGVYKCFKYTTMPSLRALYEAEKPGFPVDIKALRKFEDELTKTQERLRNKLLRAIPKSIRDKWKDSGVGLKPDRAVILIDYLYEHEDGLRLTPVAFTKTGKPSVSAKQAMPYYVADYPWVADYIEYTKGQKMLSTYIKGFYRHIRNGIIRTTFSLHKTVTGRSASSDVNLQNIPKRGKLAKLFRKIFKAPKGWSWVMADLSQAEIRFAGMISGDENIKAVYAADGDIHAMTAAGAMRLSLPEFTKLPAAVRSLSRFRAKAVNFGFLYGMWWKKFRQYAKTEYGIDYSEDEARETRELFFHTYPRLLEYHERAPAFARQHGYVRAYNGRKRHLPMIYSPDESIAKQAERYAINSPIQSIASDTGLMAMAQFIKELKRKGLTKVIKVNGFIHDALVMLVRDDYVGLAIRRCKWHMENVPFKKWFGWEPDIPIKADAEIGKTQGDMIELKPHHYSKKSGNESFKEIAGAVWREELDDATKKVESLKNGKSDKDYKEAIAEVHQLESNLEIPLTEFPPLRRGHGKVRRSKLRRPQAQETEKRVVRKVRKPYNVTKQPERNDAQGKTAKRTIRKIRRIPKAA